MLQLLYSPFPTRDAARIAASQLLAQKLVACCNIVPGIESHYWWEGALTQSSEVALWCKTTAALAEKAAAALEAIHPYACPAIIRLEAQANAAFMGWVAESTNL